jgi:hypothetical protein
MVDGISTRLAAMLPYCLCVASNGCKMRGSVMRWRPNCKQSVAIADLRPGRGVEGVLLEYVCCNIWVSRCKIAGPQIPY